MEADRNAQLTAAIAKILENKAAELCLSLRDIQEKSGVPHSTVARIFEGKTAIAIDKLEAISHALELKAWKVMQQAEKEISENTSSTPSPVMLSEAEAYKIAEELDRKLRAGMTPEQLGLAAKTREIDPLDGRGEESQIPPDWDE